MKTVAVILFSLALMLAGLPLVSACAAVAPAKKACCHCGGQMSCCQAKPTGEVPVAPLPASSQNDFQSALWLATVLLATPTPAVHETFPVTAASPLARTVPLFTRDCAFLI